MNIHEHLPVWSKFIAAAAQSTDLLCLVTFLVLAPVETAQVVSQLSMELGVQLVLTVLGQFTVQLQDQVLSHVPEEAVLDLRCLRTTDGGERCCVPIGLRGVVQLVGVDQDQVGVLDTLEVEGGLA